MKRGYLIFLFVFLIGCGIFPSVKSVQQSFVEAHSGAQVIEVSKVETPMAIEFHIKYLKSGSSVEHEEVWHYHHVVEGWVEDGRKIVK